MNDTLRVLAVDDERQHLNIISELLSDDYKVLAAKGGGKALEIANSDTPPDLILLDVVMPDMDGYQVCKKLKENERTRDIPVIFLTVKSDANDEAYGFSLGAVDYIAKPFSPPIVRARVKTHLLLNRTLLELAQHNDQLEKKIEERTREIRLAHEHRERLQIHLQQAQKMESIGLLTGGIAHDFNNILSVILGFAGLAASYGGPPRGEKLIGYLDNISAAGERAKELVEQLLAFSRGTPTTGKSMNLAKVIGDAVKLLQPILPSSITIETEFDESLPAVISDEIQMYQVTMNLCINARDAMGGVGRLKIKTRHHHHIDTVCSACQEPVSGEFVELLVEDNGPGIESALFGTIFQSLVSTKEIGQGAGMGLAIVNNIVHDHRGHILLESQPGIATRFRLLLSPATTIAAPDSRDTESLTKSGRHVLIVSDDVSLSLLLKEHLANAGYRVTVNNDATQVTSAVKEHPQNFNLVIIDHLLRDLNGLALVQTLTTQAPNLPLIICTGGPLSDDELGRAKRLAKPFTSEELLALVSASL